MTVIDALRTCQHPISNLQSISVGMGTLIAQDVELFPVNLEPMIPQAGVLLGSPGKGERCYQAFPLFALKRLRV